MVMLVQNLSMRYLRRPAGALLLALMGCSGGNSSMNMNSMTVSPAPMMTADFESIQTNIFTPLCASCHSGANPAANLGLDAAHSFNDLVNVPSTEQPLIVRVKPGDPAHSFLAIHLQDDGDGASASDIALIIQWIADGAMLSSAMPMPMPMEFRVAAVEPSSGDSRQSPPPRIIIGFTQELDRAGVFPEAVRLERVADDTDSQTAMTTPIPATLSIPADNARALMLTPAITLSPGQYRVVLDTTSGVVIRSLSGALLGAPASQVNGEHIVTRFSVTAD
jgi:hypothetical protein